MDPLQFAYRTNRSTDDAVSQVIHSSLSQVIHSSLSQVIHSSLSQVIHSSLSHLDSWKGGYVRMLYIDFSSAFNSIFGSRLADKLIELGLNTALCAWILDTLTTRTQVVRVGKHTSRPRPLNTGGPQGCVLSPILYSLYTHDCVARSSSNTFVKFADDTVVMGLISGNDEKAYLEEVANLSL